MHISLEWKQLARGQNALALQFLMNGSIWEARSIASYNSLSRTFSSNSISLSIFSINLFENCGLLKALPNLIKPKTSQVLVELTIVEMEEN